MTARIRTTTRNACGSFVESFPAGGFIAIAALSMHISSAQCVERAELPDVVVRVDTSAEVWLVTVKNFGPAPLKYEMMGKVPRGLGIEYWFRGGGGKVHADNLAELLTTHRFAPDYQTMQPGEERVFELNPHSVSGESEEVLERWNRQLARGSYECRVSFKDYASPTINPFLERLRNDSELDSGKSK